MFAIRCPYHDSPVLLSLSSIEELRNTSRGIEIGYICSCGHRGTWITGRGAACTPTAPMED
jgi:hypothetical protein